MQVDKTDDPAVAPGRGLILLLPCELPEPGLELRRVMQREGFTEARELAPGAGYRRIFLS